MCLIQIGHEHVERIARAVRVDCTALTVIAFLSICTGLNAQDRQFSLFPADVSASSRLIFFEVASQPVSEALIAFALQGNLSIGLQNTDTAGLMSPRLSGLYTKGEGLRRLLENTGCPLPLLMREP